jgi:predicted transcriptional regulator
MELHFTPEEETRLTEVAARAGRPIAVIVHDVVKQALLEEASFVEAVQRGIATADQGKLLDHDEVVSGIEKRFGC